MYRFQVNGSLCIRVHSPVLLSATILLLIGMRYCFVVFIRLRDLETFLFGTANQKPDPNKSSVASSKADDGTFTPAKHNWGWGLKNPSKKFFRVLFTLRENALRLMAPISCQHRRLSRRDEAVVWSQTQVKKGRKKWKKKRKKCCVRSFRDLLPRLIIFNFSNTNSRLVFLATSLLKTLVNNWYKL